MIKTELTSHKIKHIDIPKIFQSEILLILLKTFLKMNWFWMKKLLSI